HRLFHGLWVVPAGGRTPHSVPPHGDRANRHRAVQVLVNGYGPIRQAVAPAPFLDLPAATKTYTATAGARSKIRLDIRSGCRHWRKLHSQPDGRHFIGCRWSPHRFTSRFVGLGPIATA